jgi:predicted DNA-binding transcriptional regulator
MDTSIGDSSRNSDNDLLQSWTKRMREAEMDRDAQFRKGVGRWFLCALVREGLYAEMERRGWVNSTRESRLA